MLQNGKTFIRVTIPMLLTVVVAAANVAPAQASDQGKQVFAGSVVAGSEVDAARILPSSMSEFFAENAQKLASPKFQRVVYTKAQPGEGVIRMMVRACEDTSNWASVAADNAIGPPAYLVKLGQELRIDCGSETSPAMVPQAATAPASQPQQAYTASGSGWVRPVDACYNWGDSGFHTSARPSHDGVDLGAGFGTPIRAAAAGEVSTGWQAGGAGNYTMINHGGGVWTVYMHQSSFQVTSGWVSAGDVIGYVGSTGRSSGPHLHFEVHTEGLWNEYQVNGVWYGKVDPVSWMQDHGAGIGC